jgi:hypothetical protein
MVSIITVMARSMRAALAVYPPPRFVTERIMTAMKRSMKDVQCAPQAKSFVMGLTTTVMG